MPSDPTRLDAVAPVLTDEEINRTAGRVHDWNCNCHHGAVEHFVAREQRDATARALVADLRARRDRHREQAERDRAEGRERNAHANEVAAMECGWIAGSWEALLPEPPAGGDRG